MLKTWLPTRALVSALALVALFSPKRIMVANEAIPSVAKKLSSSIVKGATR